MEKVIFIGNGINRVHSNYAWIDLLEDLKIETHNETSIINGNKPFPVLYEEIYFRAKQSNQLEEETLLRKIVQKMTKLQSNEFHQKIMELPISHIITTNYDYTLEHCESTHFKTTNTIAEKAPEKIYRITTNNQISQKTIWHIHGELRYPRSLVLGQNMYAKVVSKINHYMEQESFLRVTQSWIDLMFLHEVHMIGFGLAYSEIDIWALLNARVRYYHTHPNKNKIFFYLYTSQAAEYSDLTSSLESYDVTVIKNAPEEAPEAFYKRILDSLQTQR